MKLGAHMHQRNIFIINVCNNLNHLIKFGFLYVKKPKTRFLQPVIQLLATAPNHSVSPRLGLGKIVKT